MTGPIAHRRERRPEFGLASRSCRSLPHCVLQPIWYFSGTTLPHGQPTTMPMKGPYERTDAQEISIGREVTTGVVAAIEPKLRDAEIERARRKLKLSSGSGPWVHRGTRGTS